MKEYKNINSIIDGSLEFQKQCAEEFLSTLTDEERERAMSSEFDYLDEDL